tara:strand:- start:5078 stop:6253 length:1176 start_codon:yes stop_codon:yes gene_type:complete
MSKKNIVIYGATGSIGTSTLNLIRNNMSKFNIVGMTCNNNIDQLLKLSIEFNCKNIGIANKDAIYKKNIKTDNIKIFSGLSEFKDIINECHVDIIIFGISGSSSLSLLLYLASSGKILGLANKECIICAGSLFMHKIKSSFTKLVPLDSEHNAIYHLIKNKQKNSIKNYLITASGGNFYNYKYEDLKKIKPEIAVTHPKWKMGNKISIDSSTLMNKGLELIEASILFDINEKNIDAIIHPESIVHGIVNFKDYSSHAFLSQPNMEISISSVLFNEEIFYSNNYNLDLTEIGSLNFHKINIENFNSLSLAKIAIKNGGLLPAVLNYSNELMVSKFLHKKALFTDITLNNELIMNKFLLDGNNIDNPSIQDIFNSFDIIDDYFSSQDILIINK